MAVTCIESGGRDAQAFSIALDGSAVVLIKHILRSGTQRGIEAKAVPRAHRSMNGLRRRCTTAREFRFNVRVVVASQTSGQFVEHVAAQVSYERQSGTFVEFVARSERVARGLQRRLTVCTRGSITLNQRGGTSASRTIAGYPAGRCGACGTLCKVE